jgi:hypothetical protein
VCAPVRPKVPDARARRPAALSARVSTVASPLAKRRRAIEIVLSRELGVGQRILLEQRPQIERSRGRASTRPVFDRIGVDQPVVPEGSRWPGQRGVDEEIRRRALHLYRAAVAPAQWKQGIGVRQSREGEWLRLEKEIVGQILAPGHASAPGNVGDWLRAVVMIEIGVSEPHIEPRRIERRRARDRPLYLRKEGIQVLERAQIEGRDVDVETVKGGERRKKDVELTLARRLGDRSRHVRILEYERRPLDPEMVEWSTRRLHVTRDFSLPIVRKLLSVEGA